MSVTPSAQEIAKLESAKRSLAISQKAVSAALSTALEAKRRRKTTKKSTGATKTTKRKAGKRKACKKH